MFPRVFFNRFSAAAVILCWSIGLSFAGERFDLSALSASFPSAGLEDRIEFWKKVFGKYGERTLIVHDRDDVRIIYKVHTFDRASDHSTAEWRHQQQWEKSRLETTAARLKELAADLTLAQRSDNHEDLAEAFDKAGVALTRQRLLRAAEKVRTQRGVRERFEAGLTRSGLYLDYIASVFRSEGLPEELAYLPHVESSFNYAAYSKVGAAGIWQFMPSTGRAYKLRVDSLVDQRLDPIAATRAAARYLRHNHEALGSWPLAVTAYNHGRNGLLRAKALYGNDYLKIVRNYESPAFGFASQNFYSEFLAALELARNHKHHFVTVRVADPLRFATLALQRPRHVKTLTAIEGVSVGVLQAYNPHLRPAVFRRGVIPAVELRLPPDKLQPVQAALRLAPTAREPKQVAVKETRRSPKGSKKTAARYRVRPGDNLSGIASRFRTSIAALRRTNRLRNTKVYVGQILMLPR